MLSKLPHEFKKYNRNRNQLRHIFKETQRVLDVIGQENFFPEGKTIKITVVSLTERAEKHDIIQ